MARSLPPVTDDPSIYEHLRAHIGADGRVAEAGRELPDEEPRTPGGITFAPGAMDGVFGHHVRGEGDPDLAELAARLRDAAAHPSTQNLRQLYGLLSSNDTAIGLADPLIDELLREPPDQAGLRDIGRWLARTACHRDAVKIGIAILGIAGLEDEDLDLLHVLGAHDEFTLFAAVAITNGAATPEPELWRLARTTDGWGRIHCVERLRGTSDPQIRDWILREGFRNSVLYEYLAYIAADTGGLLDALRGEHVDRGLLTAAGEILIALIDDGPAESIDDWADAADAVEAYLQQMDRHAEHLVDFQALTAVQGFLQQDSGWDARVATGWTATRREAFESACRALLARPEWDDRIRVALLSDDKAEFWKADMAAKARGIDTFDLYVAQLGADPYGMGWYRAWEQADHGRAERLAELVRSTLPLGLIATGTGNETGFGPEWKAHNALDWTLQALRGHPGIGGDLLLVGLNSPVVRNRNMALNALKRWPRSAWPTDARAAVEAVAASDPYDQARELAGEILRDDPDEGGEGDR
jgi:hypothetical protein